MSKLHFIDLSIRALKLPASGQVTHWDASLPGFGVRISQGGSKTWIAMRGEERRRIMIGRYPDKSLQDARGRPEISCGRNGVKAAALPYVLIRR